MLACDALFFIGLATETRNKGKSPFVVGLSCVWFWVVVLWEYSLFSGAIFRVPRGRRIARAKRSNPYYRVVL